METQTIETQATITPDIAIDILKEGNFRFLKNQQMPRDLIKQVEATQHGQFPFATILSCIDSRVPTELLFDQGVGDIFSIRVAGNIVNEDVLGSLEFGSKASGTKLIVVLGHTGCGAIKGACNDVQLGNLTKLIEKIKPAVDAVEEPKDDSLRNAQNLEFVNKVSEKNVYLSIEKIKEESEILRKMEAAGEIRIVGAMYDIETGSVAFL